MIQWEYNAQVTDIGEHIIGLGLGIIWWFKDQESPSTLRIGKTVVAAAVA